MRATLAILASVLVLVGIGVGGYEGGWWLTYNNEQKQGHLLDIQSHNIRKSYGNQQAEREQVTENIANALSITVQIAEDPSAAPQLRAQRAAVVNIVCQDAAQVSGDPLPSDQASFVQANCLDGSLNPASQYATH